MDLHLQQAIYQNPEWYTFIRARPEWYRWLSRNPNRFFDFRQQSDHFHGKTFEQKISYWQENMDQMLSLFQLLSSFSEKAQG